MASLYYSSTAVATQLSGGINNTTPTLNVGATSGFPTSFPYKLILDRGTSSEEAVLVTAVSGTALTVTRGIDGTSAVNHSTGATVEHGVTGQDFQDARNHMDATAGVHGVTGDVVGTSDTQTLTNKTLESPVIDNGDLVTPTIASFTNANHSHLDAAGGGEITKAAVSDFAHTHHDTANGGLLDFGALSAGGTDDTPTWTSTGTAPSLGNGTLTGRHIQIGKLVLYWFRLTIGNTTAKGTGAYTISLPTAARTASYLFFGEARYNGPTAPANIQLGIARLSTTGVTLDWPNTAADGDWNTWADTNYPMTQIVAGDIIDGFVIYEAA